MPQPEPLRLFIALELPDHVLQALQTLQSRLRQQPGGQAVRWVRPEGIHLTLKFLGEVPARQEADITRAMEAAALGHTALALQAMGVGCFPNPRKPRVIWVGLAGDLARLNALQGAVERALNPLGFPPEKRGFSPHLTLGRTRRDARPDAIRALSALVTGVQVESPLAEWEAASVSLIRSELRPDGARYTRLASAALRTP
ncbi:MAG: RNA 2',3'-cyclic phosphodiesterase [Anaerolineae bacterium]